jgi:large subunit ribosomal protein L4
MKANLYNQKAEVVGEIDLNPKIFEVKPNKYLLAEAVRVHLSNARQSTAHTKTRGEVRGGGRKPWKQKGTGRARAGSIRSPIWRHGGITFGPRKNRNWELKLNKKAKIKALFMSLSDKAKENQFIVIDAIKLEPVKTKEFIKVLTAFSKAVKGIGKKILLILPTADKNIVRAVRNIPGILNISASSLNVVDVLKADTILMLKDSLAAIEKHYLKTGNNKS